MSLGAAAAENDVTASVRGRRVLRPQSTDVIVCGEEIFNINATVTFGNIDIIASVTARLEKLRVRCKVRGRAKRGIN